QIRTIKLRGDDCHRLLRVMRGHRVVSFSELARRSRPSGAEAAAPAQPRPRLHSPNVLWRGRHCWRENRFGLPAAPTLVFLVVRLLHRLALGPDLKGHTLLLRARRSEFWLP